MSPLSRRIRVAAAALAGLYVLGLAVAGGAIALAVLVLVRAELPLSLAIAVPCAVIAVAILTALLPRANGLEAHGPLLTPTEHPLQRALVSEVAGRLGQRFPDDIHLTLELDAAVCDTGGPRGAGRRVLFIGLPLLEVLTVGQLRAVLAHEFGRHHGGDTRVGAWFLRSRDSISRAGTWYLRFFLRRTAAIKRDQEHFADELAVRIAGRAATIEALRTIEREWEVFALYWDAEVSEVLARGRRPPLVEGFRRYRRSGEAAAARERSSVPPPSDPYDTHPSTAARLAAIERLPEAGPAPAPGDERPAVALLGDQLDRLELALLTGMTGDQAARSLEPIAWEDVPDQVLAPAWRHYVAEHRRAFEGLTVAGLAGLPVRLQELVAALAPVGERPEDDDERVGLVVGAMGTAFGLALHDAGWQVEAQPGDPVTCRKDSSSLSPWGVVDELAAGAISNADWRRRCDELGIAGLRLDGGSGHAAAAA